MNRPATVELLSAVPGSCSSICKELAKIHGLRISGSTYQVLWQDLVRYFGVEGAIVVVQDLADIVNARRAFVRIMGKGGPDALLVEQVSKAARQGRRYFRLAQLAESREVTSPPVKSRKRIISHAHIRLPCVEFGCGIARASATGYAPIRIATSAGTTNAKGRSNWLERNLENYIERHWSELDFGLGKALQLRGRQVNLSKTREKVDLLASAARVIVPIELKIKQAGGSDLTQLQSYRQDLINRGEASENVLGILVAPRFSSKVLNVVSGNPGVILRWFEMPM